MHPSKTDSEVLKSVLKYLVPISILLSGSIIAGIIAGIHISKDKFAKERMHFNNVSASIDVTKQKLVESLQNMEKYYISDLDLPRVAKDAVKNIVEKIDPFGAFIDQESIKDKYVSDDMESIGVSLSFYKGMPQVIAPLWGSGAEESGLKPGDIIVKIDNDEIIKEQLNEKEVNIRLMGKLNSTVNLTIKRRWEDELITLNAPRIKVSNKKIYSCPITDNMGYIKISYFAQNSSKDFFNALNSLTKEKIGNVIIDLRCNPGGEIDEAIAIADKLLDDGRIICSLRGKINSYNNTFYAKEKSQYENIKFIILVDGGTAGAAEVLVGAMQDNDRALIVGTRRTFGRAILRHSVNLSDGSEILITAAKYYTPSGRSIHKSLQNAPEESILPGDYKRYALSFHQTDPLPDNENSFRTVMGRVMKAGGGLMPDFTVFTDSSHYPIFLDKINHIIKKIATEYATENANKLSKMSFEEYLKDFEVPNIVVDQISSKAEQACIACDNSILASMRPIIKSKLKAFIAKAFWKDDAYVRVIASNDELIAKCEKIFEESSFFEEGNENL